MKQIAALEAKIQLVKSKLFALGDMHPGSLSKQFNICGKKNCKCKDPKNPKKHGPYYSLSYSHKGRSTSRFIKEHLVDEVKKQTDNYKIFKQLVNEWKILATDLSKLKSTAQK